MIDLTLPILVLGAIGAAGIGARLWLNRPENRYAAFLADKANEGASPGEIDREMTLRMAAADFRRRASIAVVHAPERVNAIIAEVGKDVAMKLAAVDRETAKAFVEWIEAATLTELLHRQAMKAAYRAARISPSGRRKPVSPALVGALRITD